MLTRPGPDLIDLPQDVRASLTGSLTVQLSAELDPDWAGMPPGADGFDYSQIPNGAQTH